MADVKISALPAATSFDDADETPIVQGGTTKRATGAMVRTYPAKTANTFFSGPTSGAAAPPGFRAMVQSDIPARDATTTVEFYDDFVFGSSVQTNTSGTGASASPNSSNAVDLGNHPGQECLETGTTTTGRGAGPGFSVGVLQILFGNGAVLFESDTYLLDALSDGTDTYTLFNGFNDSVTGTGTDAIMFRYTHSINGGRWECVTRSNGVETAADSGQAVASTTWYRLRIEVNAAASSVAFYINGSLVATNTTNIPSGVGRQTTPHVGIVKSAGTNNRRLNVDYVYFKATLASAR